MSPTEEKRFEDSVHEASITCPLKRCHRKPAFSFLQISRDLTVTVTILEFPEEIIENIVSQVDGLPHVKTMSLVRIFRHSCQRRLLHTLTLMSPRFLPVHYLQWESPVDPLLICTLLDKSSNVDIAKYVRHLKIRVSPDPPPAFFKNVQKLLAKLKHVRELTLAGHNMPFDYHRWDDLDPGPLVDFISRQSLDRLHFSQIAGIPPDVFLHASPFLSFSMVTLASSFKRVLPVALTTTSASPTIRHLNCGIYTEEVYDLFARPDLQSYTAALSQVVIDPFHDATKIIISSAANTLEHITFTCLRECPQYFFNPKHIQFALDSHPVEALITLPSLPTPSLRFLEANVCVHFNISPLIDTITSMLLSSPSLHEITITFVRSETLLPTPDEHSMAALDMALVGHPAEPAIRWRINFATSVAEDYYTDFATLVKRGLPSTQKKEKVVVEKYDKVSSRNG
ncbi:hypothetical protein B0H11DRAFT_2221249 [Mycena galericulata]|nr:hypothetical protein B0H11DRAFT_2221249 [Mycena galericulata]